MKEPLFPINGPISADSPFYIVRDADTKAANCLRRMEYILLVEPRQYGKTSLIYKLRRQFSNLEYTFALRDLMPAKSSADSTELWFTSLGQWILDQLNFIPKENRPLPPKDGKSWESFLVDISKIAEANKQRVVIILDEIGAMPSDLATLFFSVIRSVYSTRESFPFYKHLTFIVSGAFDPKKLIKDEAVSSFNVASHIILNDFSIRQVKQLANHLRISASLSERVAERVYYWTDGNPYMTQRLFLYLSEYGNLLDELSINYLVDNAVEQFFQEDTNHLSHIKKIMADPHLLEYTKRATTTPQIRYNASINDKQFYLSHIVGVIKAGQEGFCEVRNRIYERVLDGIELPVSLIATPSGSIPNSGENNLWYQYNQSETVIAFVHGIFSDSRSCWQHIDQLDTNKNQYWPELVRTDPRFNNASIYLGGFYTALDSGPYEIRNCADELFEALNRVDENSRQPVMAKKDIIFVCHSTGGIVLRYILESRYASFAEKNIGLVLIASPSYGSRLANYLSWLARLYNQQLGRQLRWREWNLRDLDARFKNLLNERRIPNLYGIEAQENHFIIHRKWWRNKLVVVTEESAGRYFGAPILLRNTNHFSIVKPNSTRHPAHELLLDFYSKHFKEPL